jgi:iron complex outermembrane receptor protein
VPVSTAAPGIFGSRIVNAGKVVYTGFEVEGQAILNDNFSIDGSFGYVDVNYKEFPIPTTGAPGAPIVDISSIAAPAYTSRTTGNIAANAQFPLGINETRLVARVGFTHESPKYSFNNIIAAPFNEELRSDERNVIDAQLSIDRIALGGAEAEFKLWGKNLTNSHDFVRAVDFGSLGLGGGFYADPRTYGATVSVKF